MTPYHIFLTGEGWPPPWPEVSDLLEKFERNRGSALHHGQHQASLQLGENNRILSMTFRSLVVLEILLDYQKLFTYWHCWYSSGGFGKTEDPSEQISWAKPLIRLDICGRPYHPHPGGTPNYLSTAQVAFESHNNHLFPSGATTVSFWGKYPVEQNYDCCAGQFIAIYLISRPTTSPSPSGPTTSSLLSSGREPT